MNKTKRTYIVGSMPIKHNGQHLPPGADIELTFEEYRSLGLDLEEADGVEIIGTIETVDHLPEINLSLLNAVSAEDPAALSAALESAAKALTAETLPAKPPVEPTESTEGDAGGIKPATDTDTTAAGKPGRTKKGA